MRTSALLVPLVTLALLSACGGEEDASGDTGAGETASTASVTEVQACIEEAGLSVSESESFTEEVKKGLGIIETFTLQGDGEHAGLGGVAWYKDEKTAADAHEAASAVRTDDVARELVGTVSYHFAGVDRATSDAVGAKIKDCLS